MVFCRILACYHMLLEIAAVLPASSLLRCGQHALRTIMFHKPYDLLFPLFLFAKKLTFHANDVELYRYLDAYSCQALFQLCKAPHHMFLTQ